MKTSDTSPAADPHVLKSGFLDVGDGHQIYFEEWGNPNATPIFHFHGGPGAGFSESHKAIYDPAVHHVIFHDQRGAGRSVPFAETRDNTTQKLIEDIEKLRSHLGIEGKMHVAGGSWGSTLSLFYAIAHPEHVSSILLWSVFLGTDDQAYFPYRDHRGNPEFPFTKEYEHFASLLPEDRRDDPEAVLGYFAERMSNTADPEALKYAHEFELYERCLCYPDDYNYGSLRKEIESDANALAYSRILVHFEQNHFFVPAHHITQNIDRIKNIPCVAIQGKRDWCTPLKNAHELADAYGDNFTLTVVESGHSDSRPRTVGVDFFGCIGKFWRT